MSTPPLVKCENPSCGRVVKKLESREIEEESAFELCSLCCKHADQHHTLRKTDKKTPQLNRCANPNCHRLVQIRIRFQFEKEGWLRLCDTCHQYAFKYGKLRSTALVKKAEMQRRRFIARPTHCFNKNCRTTNLESGQYAKHNNQFYCSACARYVNRNRGQERPATLVNASTAKMRECENPYCDKKTVRLLRAEVKGKGLVRFCRACRDHAKKTGQFRPKKMVERAKAVKRRRLEK